MQFKCNTVNSKKVKTAKQLILDDEETQWFSLLECWISLPNTPVFLQQCVFYWVGGKVTHYQVPYPMKTTFCTHQASLFLDSATFLLEKSIYFIIKPTSSCLQLTSACNMWHFIINFLTLNCIFRTEPSIISNTAVRAALNTVWEPLTVSKKNSVIRPPFRIVYLCLHF